jgi:hypothetical protein
MTSTLKKISEKLTEGKISYCTSNLVWRDEIFADVILFQLYNSLFEHAHRENFSKHL